MSLHTDVQELALMYNTSPFHTIALMNDWVFGLSPKFKAQALAAVYKEVERLNAHKVV